MLNQGVTSRTDDPCLTQPSSLLRFAVFALLLLTVPSTAILLISLENRPYGIQLSSIVGYTAAVALYTFSRNRNGNQPFLLSCPVVRGQLPQLIRRHLGFLAALFIVQTMALKFRSNLPAHWITPTSRDASPFAIVLGIFCLLLAIVEILTIRSLLERAHGFDALGSERLPLPDPLQHGRLSESQSTGELDDRDGMSISVSPTLPCEVVLDGLQRTMSATSATCRMCES